MNTRAPKLRIHPTVVGINAYEQRTSGSFATLACAERDAQRIADFLHETNDAFETVDFQPYFGQNATAERIRKELRHCFKNPRLTPLDVILFYFAGHGMITSDSIAFLCCYHANPRDPSNDGLRLDDLFNQSQMPGSDATVMLIFDACYSGAIADPNHVINNAAQQMRGLLSNMQALGKGSRVVLAAAHADQAARENPMLDGGAGFFTRAILQGWRAGAARDNTGLVTPETLSQYLQAQFKDNRNQQPITSFTTATLLPIGRFEPPIPSQQSASVSVPKPSNLGGFNPYAPPIVYEPLPSKPERTEPIGAGRHRALLLGAGVAVALIASCTILTLINPVAFTLWFITAVVFALVTVPLAARSAGFLALPATVIALIQLIVLVGVAHSSYGLGAGLAFLDTLARYNWLAVVIFMAHTLFVTFYGAWVTANALWTSA